MKRKLSIALSISMLVNIIAYTASRTFADNSVGLIESRLAAEEILSKDNIKKEDVSSSLPKDHRDSVANASVQLENLSDVRSKIEADAKVPIELTTRISKGQTLITGRLLRGIGVSVYGLTDKEFVDKKFVPTTDALISNSKYTVNTQDGSFALSINTSNLKPGNHLAICVYYSLRESDGKIVNKSYFINATYGESNQQDEQQHINDNRRISGSDRFATNLASVRQSFVSSDTVVVASGNSFADPLAAGPLAMKYNAPIIFSDKDGLKADAVKLIRELGTRNVIIVGGVNSVPNSILRQLNGLNIRRISGNDRYETSAKLVKEFGQSTHLILTDGRKFADALSATPLAKKLNSPILLVNAVNKIPNNVNTYKDIYIIGGKNSVGLDISNKLRLIKGDKLYRVFGSDREATSNQVAQLLKYNENILANGSSFPDALSAVNLLNSGGKNLLLVKKNSISKDNMELTQNKTNYLIGGYNTIFESIMGY